MDQEIKWENKQDENGNPTGGWVRGTGLEIKWQDGPLGRGEKRTEPNGAFVEGVIKAALFRLYFYQSSKFKCVENENAIRYLQKAINACNSRTWSREERKVEGLHKV